MDLVSYLQEGRAVLGMELGSTRIKAVLIGPDHAPIASGDHTWENRLENGVWTYHLEDVWAGVQDAYAARYAQAYGLFCIAGSDNHLSGEGGWTAERLLGVTTEEKLADMRDFAARVRARRGLAPILRPLDVDEAGAPRLESYWLDESERPVPTGRDWLREK